MNDEYITTYDPERPHGMNMHQAYALSNQKDRRTCRARRTVERFMGLPYNHLMFLQYRIPWTLGPLWDVRLTDMSKQNIPF